MPSGSVRTTIAEFCARAGAALEAILFSFWQPAVFKSNRAAAKSPASKQRCVAQTFRACLRERRITALLRQSLKLCEKSLSIFVVNLFQNGVGQLHPVNLPTALSRIAPVVEIFITRFQPSEIIRVHIGIRFAIRSEHDAILKIHKELPGAAGLPAKLCLTRAKFHQHIGVLF